MKCLKFLITPGRECHAFYMDNLLELLRLWLSELHLLWFQDCKPNLAINIHLVYGRHFLSTDYLSRGDARHSTHLPFMTCGFIQVVFSSALPVVHIGPCKLPCCSASLNICRNARIIAPTVLMLNAQGEHHGLKTPDLLDFFSRIFQQS